VTKCRNRRILLPWKYTRGRTDEVVKLFFADRVSFIACIAALDSALEGLIPRLKAEDATGLRIVMLSNNEIVMHEMERRGPAA